MINKMNTILLDGKEIILNKDITEITIRSNSVMEIINYEGDINIHFILTDNTSLEVLDFNTVGANVSIKVTQNNNSQFNLIHSFKIGSEYRFNYQANIIGNSNYNNISIKGITTSDEAHIFADAIINKISIDNVINENIKVLTLGGKAFISPMLHVFAKDVIANHNTAISNIREEELFYLMMKGISKERAIELISNGYLYGQFKEDFINKIKDI